MERESENLNPCIGSQAKNRKPRRSVTPTPQYLHHRRVSRLSGHQLCMSFQIRGIVEVGKPWQWEGELALLISLFSLCLSTLTRALHQLLSLKLTFSCQTRGFIRNISRVTSNPNNLWLDNSYIVKITGLVHYVLLYIVAFSGDTIHQMVHLNPHGNPYYKEGLPYLFHIKFWEL